MGDWRELLGPEGGALNGFWPDFVGLDEYGRAGDNIFIGEYRRAADDSSVGMYCDDGRVL